MSDYFGYKILYVLNITDIDDKIILRARTKYLLEQYRGEMKSRSKEEVLSEIQGAVATFRSKMAEMPAEDPKLKMMQKVMADLDPVLALADPDLDQLLTLSSMAMENWLDARYLNDP